MFSTPKLHRYTMSILLPILALGLYSIFVTKIALHNSSESVAACLLIFTFLGGQKLAIDNVWKKTGSRVGWKVGSLCCIWLGVE